MAARIQNQVLLVEAGPHISWLSETASRCQLPPSEVHRGKIAAIVDVLLDAVCHPDASSKTCKQRRGHRGPILGGPAKIPDGRSKFVGVDEVITSSAA